LQEFNDLEFACPKTRSISRGNRNSADQRSTNQPSSSSKGRLVKELFGENWEWEGQWAKWIWLILQGRARDQIKVGSIAWKELGAEKNERLIVNCT
jgi:hypothetical protein